MFKNILKSVAFLSVFAIYLFGAETVSAEVLIRFITSGTFGSQTNEDSLTVCDGSTLSTYNGAFYDYFTVDNTGLPPPEEVVSVDYCTRGQGNLVVGTNTENHSYFIGNGLEQCYNTTNLVSYTQQLLNGTPYAFFGGAVDTGSSTDCLYVKVNTSAPAPTAVPSPTETPVPTNTPAPTETPVPTGIPSAGTANMCKFEAGFNIRRILEILAGQDKYLSRYTGIDWCRE